MGSIRSICIFLFVIFGAGLAHYDDDVDADSSAAESSPGIQSPTECARKCIAGEAPKTCYYKFTIEQYASLGKACSLCPGNSPSRLVNDCQCITADGYETSSLITVNRMYPGPAIIVCQNDYIVVDVVNSMHAKAATIHWHGVYQRNSPYYDGVPFVTQCPIQEGETFRYQFRAENSGTHFWHSHSGLLKAAGIMGSLIIREPQSTEPNGQYWDFESAEHVIFLTDIIHDSLDNHYPGTYIRDPEQSPDNYLVNGMGQWTDPQTRLKTTTPLATFTVKAGYRYRFRMINGCSLHCPVQMTIEGHSLQVIATDGQHVNPVNVDSITSSSAERYDFVLNASKTPGVYWIQVRGLGPCVNNTIQQFALLRYDSAAAMASPRALIEPSFTHGLEPGIVLNPLNVRCNGETKPSNVVCVSQLQSVKPVPPQILKKNADVRLYMPFDFYTFDLNDIYKPGNYQNYIVVGGSPLVAILGNITNKFPSVPMISQRHEIMEDQVCSNNDKNSTCKANHPCMCSHIESIPLNSVVEIILIDKGHVEGLSHPFHLHGHSYYIMSEAGLEDYNTTSFDTYKAMTLDKQGMIKRNVEKPPAKDTYAVPNNGFAVIRFLANNPGYWLFHCHFLVHLSAGMGAVFHVGEESDLSPVPKGFPTCRNFVPPIDNDYPLNM